MPNKVKIYSTTWCGFCKAEKDWLKQNNVPFEEVNIEQDQKAAEAMIQKSGQTGVPVTEINGKVIVGFDKAALKKELGLK
jgi:glutaredoxin-like YruB-family protein